MVLIPEPTISTLDQKILYRRFFDDVDIGCPRQKECYNGLCNAKCTNCDYFEVGEVVSVLLHDFLRKRYLWTPSVIIEKLYWDTTFFYAKVRLNNKPHSAFISNCVKDNNNIEWWC